MFTAGGPHGQRRAAAYADADAEYICPACGQGLQLRRGAVRAPHFAHRPGSGCAFVWRQAQQRHSAALVDGEQERLFEVEERFAQPAVGPAGGRVVLPAGSATLFDVDAWMWHLRRSAAAALPMLPPGPADDAQRGRRPVPDAAIAPPGAVERTGGLRRASMRRRVVRWWHTHSLRFRRRR